MTVGTFFWFVGGVLLIIAGVLVAIKSTVDPLVLVWIAAGCGFLGVAFGGTTLPARKSA